MARALQPWRYSPSVQNLRREIEDIFDRALERTNQHMASSPLPPIETFREGNEFVMRLDLPGIDPKEIEVTVSGNVATQRGSREHHDKRETWDVIYCELTHGDFERKLRLPPGIGAEDIKAAYMHGVLELRMPAPKEAAGRKVPIQF